MACRYVAGALIVRLEGRIKRKWDGLTIQEGEGMIEYIVTFNDGTGERRDTDDKIRLESYGVVFITATSDLIVPWHRIREVKRVPGSD